MPRLRAYGGEGIRVKGSLPTTPRLHARKTCNSLTGAGLGIKWISGGEDVVHLPNMAVRSVLEVGFLTNYDGGWGSQ